VEVLKIILEVLLVLGLVAANGFFVAAEFALVKIRASQLRPLARNGGWRVRMALFATTHLDAVLSSTQLGITLTSLGLGWIGEPVIGERLEPLLGQLGITDPAAVKSISFAVAFSVITFLHIVLGELTPKSLAIQRPKAVSLRVAGPLVLFYQAFFPFIWVLNGTANRILRWAGLEPASEGEHGFSAEELVRLQPSAAQPSGRCPDQPHYGQFAAVAVGHRPAGDAAPGPDGGAVGGPTDGGKLPPRADGGF